jgi:hypothetical protein
MRFCCSVARGGPGAASGGAASAAAAAHLLRGRWVGRNGSGRMHAACISRAISNLHECRAKPSAVHATPAEWHSLLHRAVSRTVYEARV